MISLVRLEVSPTASTPTGFFSQRFEALFPHAGILGCVVCHALQLFLWVYLHANMGPPTPPPTTLPTLALQLPPCWKSSLPSCPSLPLLLVWMNVSSLTPWLSDFYTIWFPGSSDCFSFLNLLFLFGCEKRHSVSSYASILTRSSHFH